MHGLGTGQMALYQVFGFDLLHVMKLGVLRLLGWKIPALLMLLCGKGKAFRGSVTDTIKVMNDRLNYLGRLCLASKAPPGCLVPKGTSQITMKGRQWRHAVVYWPFLVAGLVDASAGAATLPTAEQWVRHERKNNKRNRDKEGSDGGGSDYGAAPGGGCASDGDEMASADAAEDTSIQEEDLDALFDNEEDGDDDEVVPIDQRTYKDLFDDMPVRDAVQEVVCRAALLMGKLCGDNQADDADMSEVEARELAREAYEFVTKFMVALFGPMHTSKAHRLAYHLFDELILRGNLVDADTSVNELLHKLVKIMYRRTNKQDQAFTLQLMRAEQTLAFAVDEDADREVLRKAGLLGADGVLLDPSRNGQAELERAAMDGHP
eukprot:contig_7303_g1710